MMLTISRTLQELLPQTPAAFAQLAVSGITADSRQVKAGDVFVALKGLSRDARDFIPEVIAKGVVAVLVEHDEKYAAVQQHQGVPLLPVLGLAQEQGFIAARFYGQPSRHMPVLAVTGTNGKTSVANLLAGALTALGQRSAVLGTIGNGFYGQLASASHTTPDAIRLQQYLAEFQAAGAKAVAMEASSHGLEQGRLNGTAIHTALFTNLTRDHLDYHGDMASYAAAKAKLFQWPGLQAAVLNADDALYAELLRVLAPGIKRISYSLQADSLADLVALEITPSLQGLTIRLRSAQGEGLLHSPLLGRFNVSNLLAVLGGLLSLNIPLAQALSALAQVQAVPGRMECFNAAGITAVVDYAHTPDALEKVLSSLREHVAGELHCVFGCGGDRDKGKRPQMAAVAERLADHLVVTTDNPRSEAADAIIADILMGLQQAGQAQVEQDRRSAIRAAISQAQPGDIVLVAGKGHEDYQEIHGQRHPFSDVAEVKAALAARSAS